MASKMWIGSSPTNMQWVPCPLIDSSITRKRYVESMQFQNGGGDLRGSTQYQMEYNLSFSGPAHGAEGIDVLNKFASGYYGGGYMYLAYPTHFDTNIFSAQWAYPGLAGVNSWTNSVYSNGTVVQTRYPVRAINEITVPNYESGSMTGWTTTSGSGLTATVSTEQKLFGHTKSQKLVWEDGSDAVRTYSGTIPTTTTQLWTFSSIFYKALGTALLNIQLKLYDNEENVLWDTASLYGINYNEWAAYEKEFTYDYPTATHYTISLSAYDAGGLTMYVGGQGLYDATVGFVRFFDGASQDVGAASWEGTVNNSRSLLRNVMPANPTDTNINSLLINITGSALVVPDEKFTILVPPGKYLYLGIMGETTGTAAMYMRLDRSNTEAITMLPNGYTAGFFNTQVVGGEAGKFVEIYATRTSSAASTMRISAMMAQITDDNNTPTQLTFIPGQGSTGLAFADDATVETYSYMHPPRKAVSTTLVEVEAWQ